MGIETNAERAVLLLRGVLTQAPPEAVSGADAAVMAEVFARAERVAAAGKELYARRVAETSAHEALGHRDAASWLAEVSGEPVGRARGALEATDRVCRSAKVRKAFMAGELSGAQAAVIGSATVLNPSAAEALLRLARNGSFREMKDEAATVKRRARSEEDEVTRERRVHARRYCRTWEPEDGGLRIDALVTKADGARLLARLDQVTEEVFKEAREAGLDEPHERYRADALVRMAENTGGLPDTQVVVRVDAAALLRGSLEGTEICEIPGVGQVPVATARDLMGDAFFNLVITDGIDVRTVTGTKRTVPRALRIALTERDPTCVVPGCAVAHHLEIDHWQVDFAKNGSTCLDNLARLCGRHHAMKTRMGWRLAGGPGKWQWLAPRAGSPP